MKLKKQIQFSNFIHFKFNLEQKNVFKTNASVKNEDYFSRTTRVLIGGLRAESGVGIGHSDVQLLGTFDDRLSLFGRDGVRDLA